jgi:uncharacterized protein (TIGR02246 family)
LRDLAERYTDAWCSGDPARVAAHYAADGSLTINGGTPAIGRPAIAEAAKSFMDAFPDLRVILEELHAREGGGVYHWTLVGTNTGPGGTGNRVRISGHEQWQIADGLIDASQGRFDQAEYDRQVEHGADAGGSGFPREP